MTQRFVVDPSWRRVPNNIVIAGSPLKIFRVTDAALPIIEALENGTPLPEHHARLTERLLNSGAIHPIPSAQIDPKDITVVIPVYATTAIDIARLQHLVDQFTVDQTHVLNVIVVDDASPLEVSVVGANLIRHPDNQGPGAARNTGANACTTQYLAFVDVDCLANLQDLLATATHFENQQVGIVAPRVRSTTSDSAISHYESTFSPLDMGEKAANVVPMARVSYIPSAVMLVRRKTFDELGGFNSSLRYGEDVDFVWRAIDASWQCRYDPSVICEHYSRTTWQQLWNQRSSYGEAAAQLYTLHPTRLAPLQADLATTISTATVVMGFPLTAFSSSIISAFTLGKDLKQAGVVTNEIIRIVSDRWIHTTYMLGVAISRAWLPIVLCAAIFSKRARRLLVFAFMFPPLWDQYKKGKSPRSKQLPLTIAANVIDHSAYSFGVWKGMIRARTLGPLLPKISVKRSREG